MKRILAIILTAALLLSLGACAAFEPEAYVPSANVEVAVAYVVETDKTDGNLYDTAKVVTRRLVEKDMTSITLACVYYSSTGSQVGEYEYVECDFAEQNKFSLWEFDVPIGATYMEAVVSKVSFSDGTQETCPGISTWAKTQAEAFSVESHEQKRIDLSYSAAADAEVCPGAELTIGTWDESGLNVQLANTSGKDIEKVGIYALWFDADGQPLALDGVVTPNAELINASDLVVDETATYTVTEPEGAEFVKVIINTVTYTDGESWTNNYFYEWAYVHYDSYE